MVPCLKKPLISSWILGMRVEPPTRTTSCTWLFDILTSRKTFSTGTRVFWKWSVHRSPKRAKVSCEVKSIPSKKESILTRATVDEDSVFFARSHAVRKRRRALALFDGSAPRMFLLQDRKLAHFSLLFFLSRRWQPHAVGSLMRRSYFSTHRHTNT